MFDKTIPLESLDTGAVGVAVFSLVQPSPDSEARWEDVVPHRHDFYTCVLTEEGAADLRLDFQPVHLTASSLLVTYPGQVHQVDQPQQFRGWMLLADAKYLSPLTRSGLEQLVASPALLPLTPAEMTWFQQLFRALQAAAAPGSHLFHAEASHALLNACLAQAGHLLETHQHQQQQEHSRRSLALTRQFRHLLDQDFLTCKKPAAYADRLHVTASHLNDTVKSVTGFSVSYFIQQHVLAEAQRLLLYTDLPVQEVARRLGYEDQKYFSRFFGKGAGVPPSLFRQQGLRPPRTR
jgi:AraC family transcriptional activator of pobA